MITNASPITYETVARTTPAGEKAERVTPLNLAWPQDMYSLSHVAVPFPLNDSPVRPRADGEEPLRY
ncbi:Uncharacterised protein [Raoultella terrigena]|uniref:Uncharacterized protein n=1 Tax=Raoultella terrigena TaxID=577 RepID=A0A485BUL6_RAOTE|nr:Uncharacterised protein [Raoultella terrigena]